MRCVHCGYVSFDHLTACRRCAKLLAPSSGDALSAAIPSPDVEYPSAPRASSPQVTVPTGWIQPGDRSSLEGDISGDELDWTHFTLPSELRSPPSSELVYGGLFRRAIAVLVDAPLLLTLTGLGMVLAFLTALGGGTIAGGATHQVEALALGAALAAGGAVVPAYHVLWWGQGGQTPGKKLVGLAVVGENGEEIGYGRAFLRWVACLLALLPLGLGLLMALFHPRRRGLHDLLAGTCVVRIHAETGQ